ncbi:MAG: hypothetical protein GVY18_13790 [Bacteroidetes bacterium]|jgi:hypothetical protein|nr:hypothetical protein [Bacteroidota bacterium]
MVDHAPQTEPVTPAEHVFPIASMDGRFRVASGVVLLLAAGALTGLYIAAMFLSGTVGLLLWIAAIVSSVGLVIGLTLIRLYARPTHFELRPEGLRIVWPARSRKLPSNAFYEIRRCTETELGRLKRCFGISPVFGAFGWFRSEYMGSMDVYITRSGGLVYLRMSNRHPLLLTPEEPEEFLRALGELADRVD